MEKYPMDYKPISAQEIQRAMEASRKIRTLAELLRCKSLEVEDTVKELLLKREQLDRQFEELNKRLKKYK